MFIYCICVIVDIHQELTDWKVFGSNKLLKHFSFPHTDDKMNKRMTLSSRDQSGLVTHCEISKSENNCCIKCTLIGKRRVVVLWCDVKLI